MTVVEVGVNDSALVVERLFHSANPPFRTSSSDETDFGSGFKVWVSMCIPEQLRRPLWF